MNREVKNSGIEWIGEIPYSWQIKSVKNEFTRKQSQSSNLENNILTLARSGVKVRDISTGEGQIASDYSKYNYVTPGDLLLNPMDLVSGDNCNISNIYGVISPAYFNLGVKNHANPYFFNYYFKMQYWVGSFFAHGKGVSFENRWTLNYETLRNFPILFPPLNEQQKIVKFLDDKLSSIKSLTEQTNQSINELKKYKQSLITEAVTKGLDPNVEMKDSGIDWIGDIPKHWNIKKIKYTTSTIDTKKDFVKEDIYIGLENVLSYEGRINDYGKLVTDSKEKYFEKGNILYSKLRPYLAKAFIADITGGCSGEFIVFESFKGNKRYLLYWLISQLFTDFINATSYGAKMPRSSWDYIKETSIPRPPKHEENEIVSYLDDKSSQINKLIENKTKVIKELETYKKSLIYEYVTGKKEV
ncbi:restriction endonuclease subunit S [Mammaliicoccus sciuri]|uniref:Restriction endonuclease subunit S n=1 Tax=Mammaliicoccus sciuri TaxID=1296 RepID=A0AB37HM23_MAMSC|nr:restriction endonuclease subunit S [Mammaliicoccus sciuri]QRN91303.1 restriction endonuclease subunit S [Mammaliicoccus sciuri]